MIHPLNFLDVNCAIGPYYNPPPGHDWSAKGLLGKMDELGIAEACPVALMGRDYDPWEANRWLVANLPQSERLHPVWVVATHHTGEFPAPEQLLAEMAQNKVRMLRLFLSGRLSYLDQLDLPLLVELFDALDEHRVPLLIDCVDPLLLHAADLEPVLKGWPHMPVILSIPKVVQNERWFYYLWERYDNFNVDLPGYQVLGGIEAIVKRFGAHRLVYGSRYPYFTPLQSMLQLIYSEIEEGDKRAIAGDTMRRLLAEVRL
jgi:hypothetical protein